jgi:hypothetical protein
LTAGRIARADEVSWALKIGLPRAERAREALELEMARRTERAAGARYSMAEEIQLFHGASRVSDIAGNEKTSGTATASYLPNWCIKQLEGRFVSGDEGIHP